MKAIIIEEKEFANIHELLRDKCSEIAKDDRLMVRYHLSPDDLKIITDEVYRKFNYYFVRWAHDQGASVVR
jgi:hypothetical protein